MLQPEDEVIPNTRPSCTEEEIVARLIGWLKSPLVPRYIRVTEVGIPVDQLPFLTSLDESIDKYLYDVREAARQGLIEAAERSASVDELEQKEKAINEADDLIRKVHTFRIDVADEVARGDSAILVDRRETERTQVLHYTLASVDRWTQAKYGVSILDPIDKTRTGAQGKNLGEDDDAKRVEDGYSKQVVDSLRVSFALLVEDLAERLPRFRSGDRPNANAIANHIHERAKKQGASAVRGQGTESLRKRIAAAMKAKDEILRDM